MSQRVATRLFAIFSAHEIVAGQRQDSQEGSAKSRKAKRPRSRDFGTALVLADKLRRHVPDFVGGLAEQRMLFGCWLKSAADEMAEIALLRSRL
ncbi:hypothetical protein EB232_32090 [Mesorhizobium sp. NZP2077]|nr:hypothetical protein EB232_32090 [Mesorhizobium sp. NZP2077]